MFLLPAGASGRPDVDTTPPEVTPVYYGTQGANGWYITNVTLNWVVTDPDSPIREEHGCDAVTLVADTVGTSFTCSATSDGGTTSRTVTIKRDATPPTVSVVADRPPDANGFYNKPVTYAFVGADPTSGILSCSRITYSGPDNPGASVVGNCKDNAGNLTSATQVFKYDGTAPTIKKFTLKALEGSAQLHWLASAGTKSFQIQRAPGLKGAAQSVVFNGASLSKGFRDRGLRPGREYRYELTATDEAANSVTKTLDFVARGALLSPAPGERIAKPPLLVWSAVRGASYYNIVLVRGHRVFSAWPARTHLKLPRAWTYHGRRYRLRPGSYRWFVWPGFGPLSAGRYGKMLGGSSFTFGGRG